MFKCCSCHRKPSRRTSEEDDEDDSSRDTDDSSSSSSSEEDEKDEEEEEREIEAELAKKFKCQTQEANVVGRKDRTSKEESDEEDDDEEDDDDDDDEDESSSVEKVVVEVNGNLRNLGDDSSENGFDRDAIKEDVGEIVNCAMKIAQRICTERLEKITEETPEGSPTINGIPNGVSNVVADNKIDDTDKSKSELQKLESEESEEVVTVIEDEEGEYEIIEDVKNDKVDLEANKAHQIEEKIIEDLINELNEEADNAQELKEIIETPTDNQQQPSETNNEEAEISAYSEESNKSPIIERIGIPIEEPELDFSLRTRDPAEEASAEPIEEKPIEKSIDEPTEELSKKTSDEPKEETPPPPYCEVEIIDEIKKSELYKIENSLRENICTVQKEILEVNVEQNVCPVEEAAVEETILDSINGDLLNIPPPATPPPEEAADFEKISESSTETFPTPPPIDFDMPESSQDDETDQECNDMKTPGPPVPPWEEEIEMPPQVQDKLDRLLPKLDRYDWKPSSPGSKSLPSPPSPDSPSETGCETEVESKSSGDEQTTRMKPHGMKAAFVQRVQRTIDDVPDDEADDSVFETVSLAKDSEAVKDIPPRPVPPVARWLSQEEDEETGTSNGSEGFGGMQEPPATPVARDELAMRRHRFFADLLQAARSTAEHRVSFDPLGPIVHPGCEHDEREEHLEELVSRLESVTKRLEQVSSQQPSVAPVQTSEIAVQTKSPSPERSLSIESASEQSSSSSRESHSSSLASVVEVAKSMSVLGYEDLVAGPLHEYLQLSQKIGGDVAAHGKLVEKAFQIQLQFLKTASSRAAPTSQSEQVSLLGPTSAQIQEIQDYREKHRGSPFFNHLSAISESVPALGWVAVSPTPAPYVKEMNDAGQFYTNRVLKDWKEKDKTHVEWCKAWVKTLTDLQQFVRQHHTTGLVWAKAGSVPAGGVPPPPPPCMMPMAEPAPLINDDRSALFAEINQGENITKNLKKVTSEMQTHKNHNLRTGPAPFKAPVVSNNSGGKATLPANAPIDKPPVFTRDGKKWLVEYQKGNKNLLIDNVEMNNVVYMFRCQDSNLVIKGKINSVVMDSCRKSSVVVDSVVASIEFVNCQSVQMQVLGKVPTISVDKTDGCQMYLNKDTLNVELITSKSSEMNVMVPVGNGDYTEYPVPEQFKTLITDKGLATVAVDSLG